jgi:hypothetical protein
MQSTEFVLTPAASSAMQSSIEILAYSRPSNCKHVMQSFQLDRVHSSLSQYTTQVEVFFRTFKTYRMNLFHRRISPAPTLHNHTITMSQYQSSGILGSADGGGHGQYAAAHLPLPLDND